MVVEHDAKLLYIIRAGRERLRESFVRMAQNTAQFFRSAVKSLGRIFSPHDLSFDFSLCPKLCLSSEIYCKLVK